MITAFFVAIAILIGAGALFIVYLYGEIRNLEGYEQGLSDAEEVFNESVTTKTSKRDL